MTKEIEVKILKINKNEVIKKLEKLGAKKILDCRMRIKVFDFPDNRLDEKKSHVRIRKEGKNSTFAFKQLGSQKGVKVSEEIEMKIDDPDGMEEFLKAIGMVLKREEEKDRICYVYNNIEFSIDTWPKIPTYLEIEAKDMEKIKEGAELLGFVEKDLNTVSGFELLKSYGIDLKKLKVFKF